MTEMERQQTIDWRDYITTDPNLCGGKLCVRGLRIRVIDVLQMLTYSEPEEILRDFPALTAKDLRAVLAYAAWLVQRLDAIEAGGAAREQ